MCQRSACRSLLSKAQQRRGSHARRQSCCSSSSLYTCARAPEAQGQWALPTSRVPLNARPHDNHSNNKARWAEAERGAHMRYDKAALFHLLAHVCGHHRRGQGSRLHTLYLARHGVAKAHTVPQAHVPVCIISGARKWPGCLLPQLLLLLFPLPNLHTNTRSHEAGTVRCRAACCMHLNLSQRGCYSALAPTSPCWCQRR